ncbi:hypothetical protein GMJAKD_09415 [Candidatus Electrothrix aarhusensis]
MKLQWDHKKYTTGFAHIDQQHSELFNGINGLMLFLKQSTAGENQKNKEICNNNHFLILKIPSR